MRPSRYGAAIRSLESCGSTNDEARAWANAGAPDGAVITALSQTKGRGRLGRAWHSEGDGLYLSIIARPQLTPAQLPVLSLLVGLSVAETLDSFLPPTKKALVKWPNDVLVEGRKISGVLLELSVVRERCEFVIIGVGVNVNQRDLPEELSSIATSMAREAAGQFSLSDVLWALLSRVEACVDALGRGEAPLLLARWRARAFTLGKRVTAAQPSGAVVGEALDVNADGALLLRDDAGVTHTIVAGDVS